MNLVISQILPLDIFLNGNLVVTLVTFLIFVLLVINNLLHSYRAQLTIDFKQLIITFAYKQC